MPIPGSSVSFLPTVSAGTLYSCGLGFNTGYCWGNNSAGQLGNGTVTSSSVPVAVSGGLNFADRISTGAHHACGPVNTFANGIQFSYAYCWGDNSFGQLGNGTTTNNATPIVVAGGLNFRTVSAGGRHTCGLTSSLPSSPTAGGAAYCWGDNSSGQLGNGTTTSSSVPFNVAGQP
jgi:hypothetical protein